MKLISKKDLLAVMGISYGQLYRWKRQRLIPEEWFIKKASYTGQETFFPRDQIISRIETILELKDQYSMEQLAEMFSKGNNKAEGLSNEAIQEIEEIPAAWRENLPMLLQREKIGLDEIVVVVYLAGLDGISEGNKKIILENLPENIPLGSDGRIGVIKADEMYHLVILKGTAEVIFGTEIQVELQAWSSIADTLRLKYKYLFK